MLHETLIVNALPFKSWYVTRAAKMSAQANFELQTKDK